jgi:hypothetical protein
VRKRVSIFFLNQPDFSKYACEYLILKLNTLQSAFEFEVDGMVFDENNHFSSETSHVSTQLLDAFNSALQASPNKPKKDQYYIGIGRMGIDPKNDLFYTIRDNMRSSLPGLAEDVFRPPCLREPPVLAGRHPNTLSLHMHGAQNILYHEHTRGCLIDYTKDKQENRVDLLRATSIDS